MPLLEIKSLTVKHIGPVNLSLDPEEFVFISGTSGAGKSLLLKAIADIIMHDGDMVLDGVNYQSISPPQWRKQVGLLPAESQWWADQVRDHFDCPGDIPLQKVGLGDAACDWHLSRCSTGEKQRLALLRLLQNQPRILLLDEPTASLDPQSVMNVEKLVIEFVKAHKAAVLWVSHDQQQIKRIATRHYVFNEGQLDEC